MTDDTEDRIIARLDTLLDEERAALLDGDLGRIGAGVDEKERLIDALNAVQDRQNDLAALQAKVVRNQGLLDGALQGIRSVAARMASYRQIRRSMETYDSRGRKHTIPGEVARTVQKRA
ncbi:flagellar protein FlgN [Roseovarius sp. D22-M7]|uniref:flagellar protein FlgN n=1 Tax=Roseovarius sp. D22-M7 TaxID=3127116 RepID=UPI00300F80F4